MGSSCLFSAVVPFLYNRGRHRLFISEKHEICALLGCNRAFVHRVTDICSQIWGSSFKNISTKCYQMNIGLLRDNVKQISTLLGCYTAYIGSWLPAFRDIQSVPSSMVKKAKNCFNLEDGNERASRNFGNYLSINAV